ncbi:LuxR family transcriptional regulator [Desulfofundulus thermocisternus]|uniref:LuxR family transcriptional regulator n=1 Tax=Desulfofundulus thermocisternus TaxID=42471 RepID=UPI00217DB7BF|nr:LuxR C-terminal-related transcriptional regulator [Desulfofundulus thermocisternus]MCS5695729.1 LuxR C-terminal-related transcriptional regulator [Desulfofundulus thermocisternus]
MQSYARCRSLQVPPDLVKPRRILSETELGPRLKAGASFIAVAEGVITPVCRTGPQREYIYILCNPDLVALRIFAAPEVLAVAGKAGVKPGAVFTEESCGTNALALAREHQRLVAIRGEQHYCRLFKNWWCVAGPVKDPNGEISGYLDISMHAEKELGLAAALLQTLVALIERELLLVERSQRQQTDSIALAPLRIPPEVAAKLTAREREVLKLILEWLDDVEIAKRLYLSIGTAKTHRRNIYQKLGVSNLRELLAKLSR